MKRQTYLVLLVSQEQLQRESSQLDLDLDLECRQHHEHVSGFVFVWPIVLNLDRFGKSSWAKMTVPFIVLCEK